MIYFVSPPDRSRIKIGTTVRLSTRIVQLSRIHGELEVVAVMDGGYEVETALHRRFAGLNIEKEWFSPGDELMEFVATEARTWDGRDEARPVRYVLMEDELCDKAREVAALQGVSLAELFDSLLRPWVDQEWAKAVRKLKRELAESP